MIFPTVVHRISIRFRDLDDVSTMFHIPSSNLIALETGPAVDLPTKKLVILHVFFVHLRGIIPIFDFGSLGTPGSVRRQAGGHLRERDRRIAELELRVAQQDQQARQTNDAGDVSPPVVKHGSGKCTIYRCIHRYACIFIDIFLDSIR